MYETKRPPLPAGTFFTVMNDLARSLPSPQGLGALAWWEETDWLAAEWIVYWQNAASWLVQRIKVADLSPPTTVWERLQSVDADSRERTLQMLIETSVLLSALEGEGIPALPIKGAALAPVYYPDPTMRPLGDIDILVHEKDIQGGLEILKRLGYTFFSRSAKDYVYFLGTRKKNVWAPDNVHPVEMHFRLDWYHTTGMSDELSEILWRGSVYRPYGQEGSFRLPDEIGNFLTVCAHSTTDRINHAAKLIQILDIQLVAARLSDDHWSKLLEMTNASLARLIYPGLALASKYAPIEAPPEVIQQLKQACPPRLQEWVAEIEFAHAEPNGAFNRGIKFNSARILARSPLERWRILFRLLFPRRWDLTNPGEDLFHGDRIINFYDRILHSILWPACYVLVFAARLWNGIRSLFVTG